MSKIIAYWDSESSRNAAGGQADLILATAQGAADGWAKHIQGDAVIEIAIAMGNFAGGNVLANAGPSYAWDGQGWTFAPILEAREGWDGNGGEADGKVTLGQDKLGDLFFDPQGQAGVPSNKVDAFGLFQHEIAHAIGFIDFQPAWYENGSMVYNDENTTTVLGGPAKLDDARAHVSGVEDLMDPYSPWGWRPQISDLDLALLQDKGLPIATDRKDQIWLGSKSDTFSAFGGDDYVEGGRGDDHIDGGAGKDWLYGGVGNDTLLGGAGADGLEGGEGDDLLEGGTGADRLYAGLGDDNLRGDAGDDVLEGGDGTDILNGGAGADLIMGGRGGDRVAGGAGDDTFVITFGDLETKGIRDLIVDFQGAGQSGGDVIQFSGFAAASTLDLIGTSGNARVYEVHDAAGESQGQLQVSAGGALGPLLTLNDFLFA